MTEVQIKKELYKQKPVAEFICAKKGYLLYGAPLIVGDADSIVIQFHIWFTELGDATFTPKMPAQSLIRYIVLPETTQP